MKIHILSFIAATLMRFLSISSRYRLYFQSEEDRIFFINSMSSKLPELDKRYILAFFHQDELSLIPYFRNIKMGVLVSISKDGEIMNHTISKLGYVTTRGSSSKKAVSGLIAAIKKVKEGHKFAMAVDGPKGPIYKVKEGVIVISNKTETPIVPVKAFPHRYKLFAKAWNQAKFPRPFTTIDLVFGKFGSYSKDELETTMNSIQHDTTNLISL